jgi:hypothetical protein
MAEVGLTMAGREADVRADLYVVGGRCVGLEAMQHGMEDHGSVAGSEHREAERLPWRQGGIEAARTRA